MIRTRLVALRALIRAHAWAAAGVAAAVLALAAVGLFALFALGGDDASQPDDGDSEVVAPTPPPVADVFIEAGESVPPLGPVIVAFEEPPPEQDPTLLVRIEPRVEGQYVWLDERRLLFQPDYPGLQRGAQYALVVDGAAAGISGDRTLPITVTGQLTVDNVIPADGDEEVPTEAQVLVQFSRSVAPLTTLAARGTAPVVEFDPPLAGEGEWLNTSLYRFVPSDTRPSTTYRLRIAAGLTSAADGRLEDDFTWSFSTIQPALASSFPAGDTQFVSLATEIVVTFNQPMDRAALEAGVLVSANGAPVPGAFRWSAADTVATFVPAAQLAGGTRYTARVPAGLPGAAGGATREARTIAFRTFDPPRVEDTSPRDGELFADRFGIYVEYNNPMNLESFEGLVTVSGLTAEEFEVPLLGESRGLRINAPLKPSTAYTVAIAAGGQDRDGQIAPAHTFRFTTGARRPQLSLSIPSSTSTYAASAEPILYYFATNMDSATFTLHRVDEARALELIESYGADRFVPTGRPLRTWTVPLTDVRDTVNLHSTSLSGSGEPLPTGHYFLTANNPDRPARVFFSVVDVTLVTKLSVDELLVWALDYDSGEPLRGLSVQASGPGISLPTTVTNASGIASFTVPGPADPVFNNRQRAYVAHLVGGERTGVAHSEARNGIYDLGVPQDLSQRTFVSLVYSERPIYRPGETVYFKGVLRRDDDARYSLPGADVGVDLVLRDARGDELLKQRVQPNAFGTFVGELELPQEASTGSYGIELSEARQDFRSFITFASFIVAEFRTPEFSVEVRSDEEHFVDGDEVPTTAAATFFFGGAVSGAAVEWTAFGDPTSIRVAGFERYTFDDFDFFRRSGIDTRLRAEGEAETDESGEARFAVPAALQGREGAHRLQISATVIDQNDQAVASSTSVTIHPATYHAGIATESYVARAGEETTFQLVTVDIEGELLPRRGVSVEVYEREWVTTKEQTSSGAVYRSEPVDTLLTTLTATTGDDAEAGVAYTPANSGTLRVVAVARDAQGREARAARFLWVSGSKTASWRIRNDDVIELIADRDVYEVGDTAEILVPAPFPGATALVTVERGKVINRRVVTFEGNSERIQVPILDGYVPNVFVGVVLYRAPTADDPVPRYNVGYVELSVSTDSRKLIVSVEPQVERAVPGETVRYDVTVTDTRGRGLEAELSVAIVDAAVLSLSEQVGPDGLRAFWFQRGLGVLTASSLAVSVDRLNDVTREADTGRKGGGARACARTSATPRSGRASSSPTPPARRVSSSCCRTTSRRGGRRPSPSPATRWSARAPASCW